MIQNIKLPIKKPLSSALEVSMSKFVPWTIALFLLFPAAGSVQARDFFGGVGITPTFLTVDYADLNDYLEGIGVPALNDGSFLMGWKLYFYVHPSVRVGLMGAGGSKTEADASSNITREAKVGMGFLGATGEYVFSFMRGDVAVGAMLGWGHADIELRQISKNPIPWDHIWDDYQLSEAPDNFMTILGGNFLAYQPFVRLKYKLTGWLSLEGSVGYLGAEVSTWKQREDVDIENEPSLDFSGLIVSFGPHLGF